MIRIRLATAEDVLVLAHAVRSLASELDFGANEAHALDIVVREIGANAVRHAGGGVATFGRCEEVDASLLSSSSPSGRVGIEIVVVDAGPGIADVEAACRDGFSTAGSLGLGLGAARRLSDALVIDAAPGGGTRVVVRKSARGVR